MKNIVKIFTIIVITGLMLTSCDTPVDADGTNIDDLSLGKKAGPNTIFDLDFSESTDDDDNTASNAGWIVDRKAPESFSSTDFDGDDRLQINIDEAGPTSGFYTYQGMKYHDADESYWNAKKNPRFSYSFYIDPDWEDDGGKEQQTGVWPVLGNEDGEISAYPILEYQDSDRNENGEAGFRAYIYVSDDNGNFVEAKWVSIGLPKQLKIDPDKGGWVTVEAQLQKNNEGSVVKWRINNKLILDERGYNVFASSTQYLEFIFNSPNFGEDQDYYYDDIRLTEAGK